MNKVLVIGNGGREHAIIHKIKESPLVSEIFCINGNGGICEIANCVADINVNDHEAIIKFCRDKAIDLVVVGPEQPLVEGIVNDLKDADINVFGPSRMAAKLEGSKIFTKEICDEYDIPTAKYQAFQNQEDAIEYLDFIDMPCVIKADGIAAGKGVVIAQNKKEATKAIEEIFGGKFGDAGKELIIEEFLEGEEVSFFAICDGKKALFCGTAGDHKKVGEGETGPNTGGMGTYSPSPFISNDLRKQIMVDIINPTMTAMRYKGSAFVGFLFAGLILTKKGPKLLEFNTRLGDPEAQTILLRLESDLFQLMLKATEGNLENCGITFSDKSAVCVVMAAKGYPDSYQKNTEIKNLQSVQDSNPNITIFHAGTKKENGKILANGGRVLGVAALGHNIEEAREEAYKAVEKIEWSDGFYRKDIALKAI
ncbi:MAG: phosphoribosylamine--glycine ligase [Proteobacteria bacterium]|nr:phosphoribosylamine--glycine ligase [Pseudomonadota bacterium]